MLPRGSARSALAERAILCESARQGYKGFFCDCSRHNPFYEAGVAVMCYLKDRGIEQVIAPHRRPPCKNGGERWMCSSKRLALACTRRRIRGCCACSWAHGDASSGCASGQAGSARWCRDPAWCSLAHGRAMLEQPVASAQDDPAPDACG